VPWNLQDWREKFASLDGESRHLYGNHYGVHLISSKLRWWRYKIHFAVLIWWQVLFTKRGIQAIPSYMTPPPKQTTFQQSYSRNKPPDVMRPRASRPKKMAVSSFWSNRRQTPVALCFLHYVLYDTSCTPQGAYFPQTLSQLFAFGASINCCPGPSKAGASGPWRLPFFGFLRIPSKRNTNRASSP
jgi:hypothetical protein